MTSAHRRDDVRIYLKECRSLAEYGYQVSLVVADGRGDSTQEGVRIVDAGPRSGRRVGRALVTASRVFAAARRERASIYHLHDPELIPWGLLLRLSGAKVIYDAHENLPHDILAKRYLPRYATRVLSAAIDPCELIAARLLGAVVAATPDILDRFHSVHLREGVYNFPLSGELSQPSSNWEWRANQACYVGGISIDRGIREIARAAQLCRSRVVMAGPLWDGLTLEQAEQLSGWTCIDYRGSISRGAVADLMGSSRIGIVTFLPTPGNINALPNKLFEYMSAGIPVVASHFRQWREIVLDTQCGLCVDPCDPAAIAAAIDHFINDPELAERCGRNGAEAVEAQFNWSAQARKLTTFYQKIKPSRPDPDLRSGP